MLGTSTGTSTGTSRVLTVPLVRITVAQVLYAAHEILPDGRQGRRTGNVTRWLQPTCLSRILSKNVRPRDVPCACLANEIATLLLEAAATSSATPDHSPRASRAASSGGAPEAWPSYSVTGAGAGAGAGTGTGAVTGGTGSPGSSQGPIQRARARDEGSARVGGARAGGSISWLWMPRVRTIACSRVTHWSGGRHGASSLSPNICRPPVSPTSPSFYEAMVTSASRCCMRGRGGWRGRALVLGGVGRAPGFWLHPDRRHAMRECR